MKQIVALTGATGFLGRHLLEALLDKGFVVRALTRRNQEPRAGVEWVRGDIVDPAAMMALTRRADIVIHAAGLIKAKTRSEFFRINRDGTERLLKSASENGVKRFLFISSLAAREPHLSHYAASKAAAESLILDRKWPYETLIMRPPAIYGPGDMEILKILKATKYGFLPAPGSIKNRFSMIHGADLAKAISILINFKAFTQKPIFEIDDGKEKGYTIPDIAQAIAAATGEAPVKCIPIPSWAIKPLSSINLMISKVFSTTPMLTPSKAAELIHSDWTASPTKNIYIRGWQIEHDLTSGLKNTIEWYRHNKFM